MFIRAGGWFVPAPMLLAFTIHFDSLVIKGEWSRHNGAEAVWIATGLCIILMWIFVLKAKRMSRVLEFGELAKGSVLVRIPLGPAQLLIFSYTDVDGREWEVGSLQLNRLRHRGLLDGNPISVMYDPTDPERAYWLHDLTGTTPKGAGGVECPPS